MITLGFVLLWFVSDWGKLSGQISLISIFGIVIFGTTLFAELVFQTIEHLAAKLSHESNYYWALLVASAMYAVYIRDDFAGYMGLFFLVFLLRGLVVGLIQLRNTSN